MTADPVLSTVIAARDEAETKAWSALAGYKFWMFGYHAAAWVKFNGLLPAAYRAPNPFRDVVHLARRKQADDSPTLADANSLTLAFGQAPEDQAA